VRLDVPFRTRSLKVKLILSYLVILGAGGLLTSLVGSWIVSTTIMAQAQRTAEHDLVTARTIYEGQLATVRHAVALAGPAIRLEAARGLPELRQRLAATLAEAQCDFLTLTDPAGRVRLRVGGSDAAGDDVTDLAVVQAALAGRVAAGAALLSTTQLAREDPALAAQARLAIDPAPDRPADSAGVLTEGLLLMAAAPVLDAGGRVAGALYAGRLLSGRFDLVDTVWTLLYRGEQYRREDVGTVTIFQRDVRIATTVRDAQGGRAVGTRVSAPVREAVLDQGRPWRSRAYVVDDWYIAAYDPIRALDGSIIGILYVGVLERAYASIRDRVILSFFAIASIGFLVIIGITYVMISNITRPIGNMVVATHRIAAGQLDQEVQAAGQGELTLLAHAFNGMLASLRTMKADLEDWGRTLEEKVRQRTEEVTAMQLRVAQSERLASLGMLAAGVAHEVNNPLGGILALTALTLEDLPADDPNRRNLEVVVQQTERCRDIVKGLLDFSRQSDVSMEELQINEVLDQTLELVTQQSAFFNVRVERAWANDLPPITGDRSQLQQVFLNILVNAVQAMGERGVITIRTAVRAGEVEVAITDTGCGIPRDVIDRIFDPFFTTREGGRGTGLGLAIAYGIVTRHRGHIGVQSTPGTGTTFSIRLPAAEGFEPGTRPGAEAVVGAR